MNSGDLGSFMGWLAVLALTAGGSMAVCASSGDTGPATRALRAHGFDDVVFVDHGPAGEFHGCADGEVWSDARARNSRGDVVDVLVCCGVFLKSCTVRVR